MAVSPGNIILASQFNSLQNRIASVLGNGVGTFGYGQTVGSSQISAGATVTAARMATLRNDMARAWLHQTGSLLPLDVINTGDIIGADTSGTGLTFDNAGNYSFDNANTTKGFNDYLVRMTTIESNRFDIAVSQQEVNPAIRTNIRTTQWSYTTVTSEFTVSFASTNARRHFFNSGGQVRISGAVTNLASGTPSYQRNLGWQEMITNPGVILFDHDSISVTGTSATNIQFPNTQNIGNTQLTNASYIVLFRKNANSGVYENSYWTVEGRQDSPTVLRFRVSLVDRGPEGDPDNNISVIEEPVTADVTMSYGGRRADEPAPSGSPPTSVDVPFPTYTVVKSFQ